MWKLSQNIFPNLYNSLQTSFLSLAWPWPGRSLPQGNQWECWDPGLGPNVVRLPVHLPPQYTPDTHWCPWHPKMAPTPPRSPQCPYTPSGPWIPRVPASPPIHPWHPLMPLTTQNGSLHPLGAPFTPSGPWILESLLASQYTLTPHTP